MNQCTRIAFLTVLTAGFTMLLAGCTTLQSRSRASSETGAAAGGPAPTYGSGTQTPPANSPTATPAETRWTYRESPALPGGQKPVRRIQVVTFPAGSASLNTEAGGGLGLVSEELKLNSRWDVLVVGFADRMNESSNAQSLAKRRAQTVADNLAAQGVPRERIHVQSMGATYAQGDQWTPVAQEQDRRVEVWAFWE